MHMPYSMVSFRMTLTGAYPEIWIRGGGREAVGSRPLPAPPIRSTPLPVPPFPSPPGPLPPPLSFPFPFPPLPLEVGPLNPARGSGERCKLLQQLAAGSGAEPQPKLNLVYFSLKI